MNEIVKGKQSLLFLHAPRIVSASSVVGSKESEGPLRKLFDRAEKDDLFGAQTWEEAESTMQKEACMTALRKAGISAEEIRYLFGGDLLRQGIATSMGVEDFQIPMFGLYGACSTSGEALALAAMSASDSSLFEGLYFLPFFSERSALKGEYAFGLSCNSALMFQYSSGTNA